MAGNFHVLGRKSLMPGCNRSVLCTGQAGLAAAAKGLNSAKLTKKVLIFVGLGLLSFQYNVDKRGIRRDCVGREVMGSEL